jgi:hypothetical protein
MTLQSSHTSSTDFPSDEEYKRLAKTLRTLQETIHYLQKISKQDHAALESPEATFIRLAASAEKELATHLASIEARHRTRCPVDHKDDKAPVRDRARELLLDKFDVTLAQRATLFLCLCFASPI